MLTNQARISPSAEVERANQIRNTQLFKFIISIIVLLSSLLICLLYYKCNNAADAFVFIVGLISLSTSFVFAQRSWEKLQSVESQTSNAYRKDLRELYLCLKQMLDTDSPTFEEESSNADVLKAAIGAHLTKAAIQIDAKHGGGLVLDAERERGQFNRLHAACLKFGLADPVRRNYYPKDAVVR